MIEVFKTDVTDKNYADALVELLQHRFPAYEANFDLLDCDRILRIKSPYGNIQVAAVITLLHEYGFFAKVLPDEVPDMNRLRRYKLAGKEILY